MVPIVGVKIIESRFTIRKNIASAVIEDGSLLAHLSSQTSATFLSSRDQISTCRGNCRTIAITLTNPSSPSVFSRSRSNNSQSPKPLTENISFFHNVQTITSSYGMSTRLVVHGARGFRLVPISGFKSIRVDFLASSSFEREDAVYYLVS